MRRTQRRSSFYYTNGRVTTGFCKEVQEVPYYRSPPAQANYAYNYPQTYGYASPPVIPRATYYGYPYRPHPAPTYQPAPSIAYPNTTHHPPPSTYLNAPQDQFGGSNQSPIHGSSRSAASSPYVTPNSIRDWAYGVDQGSVRPPTSVHSDVQYASATSHHSEKYEDQDRRWDERKSRRGSVYTPSSYTYKTGDYKTDGRSQMDGRSSRPDPQQNKSRRKRATQEPPPRHSYYFYMNWAR